MPAITNMRRWSTCCWALTEDQDSVAVLRACGVELVKLRKDLSDYIDTELTDLISESARKQSPPRVSSAYCNARPSMSSHRAASR